MKLKHNNKGFSLVELIVVIAIMAILGGVGTAGYTKYIAKSNRNVDITTVGNVLRVLDTNTLAITSDLPEQLSSEGIQFPVGFVVLSNKEMEGDSGNKVTAIVKQTDKTTLIDSMEAGFGDDYPNSLKLKSDSWSEVSFPTFFDSGTEMVGKVNTLGTGLINILNLIGASNGTLSLGSLSLQITEEGHEDAADLFLDFADKTVQKSNTTKDAETKKNEFLTNWNNAKDASYDGYGFGMSGREYYSAARSAYNTSFASYVEKQGDSPEGIDGSHDCATHVTSINNFGEKAGTMVKQEGQEKIDNSNLNYFGKIAANGALSLAEGYINGSSNTRDMIFPYTVCDNAFEDTSAGADFQSCAVCKALYTQYIDSGTCAENGSAFYDTMLTASTAGRDKLNEPGMTSDNFFAWMTEQTEAFSEMYSEVQALTNGKSSIVITVYSEDGLLTYDVSPEDANPRNK